MYQKVWVLSFLPTFYPLKRKKRYGLINKSTESKQENKLVACSIPGEGEQQDSLFLVCGGNQKKLWMGVHVSAKRERREIEKEKKREEEKKREQRKTLYPKRH